MIDVYKSFIVVMLATIIMLPADVKAQDYTITAIGTINQVYASNSTADGSVVVGDAFNATLHFNTSALTSDLTTVNGESTGVYGFPLSYTFNAGKFSISGSTTSPTLVVEDNYTFSPTFTGDSVGFSIFGGFSTLTPFTFSTPGAYTSFNLAGYDTTSSTLSNAALSSVNYLNAFPNKYAQVGFTNSDFTDSAFFDVAVKSFSVSDASAAPEPSTWFMLITGIVTMSVAMRRRKSVEQYLSNV